MNTYTARATREEGWWTVTVDEIPGLFTQARRLDQIPAQVRDALGLFPEYEQHPHQAAVTVIPTGHYAAIANDITQARNEAEQAQQHLTAITTTAAHQLHTDGLPYRDIGSLLGVSFQRAAQLCAA